VSPNLIIAQQLYENDGPFRWEVEARILAGQTDAEIASATGFPSAVITAFEQHFFRIRDRLAAGDYILFDVVGYDPVHGIERGNLRMLWNYFGYAAGWRMLEIVMAVSQGLSLPSWVIDSAPTPAHLEELVSCTKMAIWASTGPLTPKTQRKLLLVQMQMLELRQKSGASAEQTPALGAGSTNCLGHAELDIAVDVPSDAESRPKEREFAAVA